MLRCVKAHTVASFGTIPVGSLWDDESPYVVEADCFEDADKPKPVAKKAAAKSVAPTVKES